ncbi:hemerythrin domain-containing protein [Mesorhizobium sp. 43Arga]
MAASGDVCLLHDRKLRIYDELEAIADGLPSVNRSRCLLRANELVPLLRMSHAREQVHLFPAFARDATDGNPMASLRLGAEHIEDECAAQDLTDTLLTIGHGGRAATPEALGFMLRAFFVRHGDTSHSSASTSCRLSHRRIERTDRRPRLSVNTPKCPNSVAAGSRYRPRHDDCL